MLYRYSPILSVFFHYYKRFFCILHKFAQILRFCQYKVNGRGGIHQKPIKLLFLQIKNVIATDIAPPTLGLKLKMPAEKLYRDLFFFQLHGHDSAIE